MKNLIALSLVAVFAGCTVTPVPSGRVTVSPAFDIIYIWDNTQSRYFYVRDGRRYYMPPEWRVDKHPLPRHPHGGPPGQMKK